MDVSLTRNVYALLVSKGFEPVREVRHTLEPDKVCGEDSDGLREGNIFRSTAANVDQLLRDVSLISDSELLNNLVSQVTGHAFPQRLTPNTSFVLPRSLALRLNGFVSKNPDSKEDSSMSVGAPEPSVIRQVVFLNCASMTETAEGVCVRRSPSATNRDRSVCRDDLGGALSAKALK